MDIPVSNDLLAQEMEPVDMLIFKIRSSLNFVARVSANAFSSLLDIPDAVQFAAAFQAECGNL